MDQFIDEEHSFEEYIKVTNMPLELFEEFLLPFLVLW